jgi:hypothetical protein
MRRLYLWLLPYWAKLRTKLRDDSGTVGTETAWVTGLLIAGAATIVGILIAWGIDAANSIPAPGPAPGPAQP